MQIVVDTMGGDYAPAEVVAGVRFAVAEYGVRMLLVGDEARIGAELRGEAGSIAGRNARGAETSSV